MSNHPNTPNSKLVVWIAECFSCQFDIIQLLQQAENLPNLRIISSHTKPRPELAQLSDAHFLQPAIANSAPWLLEQCVAQQVNVLFCGKKPHHLEPYRAEFAQHGIQLVTGAMGLEQHLAIEDKYAFFERCQQQQLPVIPAIKVESADDMAAAIALTKQQGHAEVCVKPVVGVYGFGFCRLHGDWPLFRHFEDPLLSNTQQFLQAYASQAQPRPYLVMPYLEGQECSVDIACDHGRVLSHITRIKYEGYQHCMLKGPCDAVCQQLVALFACDGLINIQFKQDAAGKWFILEINNRPAGGFAYGHHTGVNLMADLMAHKLGLPPAQNPTLASVWVRPVTQTLAVAPICD